MSYSNHPKNYAVQNTSVLPATRVALGMGTVGAVIGGSAAAARNIKKVRNQETDKASAVKAIAKEAAGVGVATGVASALVTRVAPKSCVLGLIGLAALATGTKFLFDSVTEKKELSAATETDEDPKKTAKKTTKTEKTKKVDK